MSFSLSWFSQAWRNLARASRLWLRLRLQRLRDAICPNGALRIIWHEGHAARIVGAVGLRERLHKRFAEVVLRLNPVGTRDLAVGSHEPSIAFCRQRIGIPIEDHLVGREDVVVVVDLDVALHHHAVTVSIFDYAVR